MNKELSQLLAGLLQAGKISSNDYILVVNSIVDYVGELRKQWNVDNIPVIIKEILVEKRVEVPIIEHTGPCTWEEAEMNTIQKAVNSVRYIKDAAVVLHMSERTLYRKMKEYKIIKQY